MPYKDKSKQLAYQKEYHARPEIKIKVRSRMKALAARHRDKFREWKATLKCIRCGEDHVACLEFHHLDPSKKDFEIGQASGKSLEYIKKEVAKCMVLCANCHRKEHFAKTKDCVAHR